jgi:hypothetical protein
VTTGRGVTPAEREAWIRAQLEKAPPLTAEQQRDLRRVLLPAKPARKPA